VHWFFKQAHELFLSVIIDDLDIGGPLGRPDKTNTPLPIYPHGMLSCPITFQFFQMVAWWET